MSQLPIPGANGFFDKLGTGRILPPFDVVWSFHQRTVHKDTMPLTALCTSSRLFKWLAMPQGSSAARGWFVRKINKVTKGLDRIAAYLDSVVVFDSDPSAHVISMKETFLRLRKRIISIRCCHWHHGCGFSPPHHLFFLASFKLHAGKVGALTKMPMPDDTKQLRSLMGGVGCYEKFCTIG